MALWRNQTWMTMSLNESPDPGVSRPRWERQLAPQKNQVPPRQIQSRNMSPQLSRDFDPRLKSNYKGISPFIARAILGGFPFYRPGDIGWSMWLCVPQVVLISFTWVQKSVDPSLSYDVSQRRHGHSVAMIMTSCAMSKINSCTWSEDWTLNL